MTNIYERVKSGDVAQRQIARRLLVQNFGVVPACCSILKGGKVSCERYRNLTRALCLECQKDLLRCLK